MSNLVNIAPRMTRVAMSNRQYAALRLFDKNLKTVLDVDQALTVDQRSFGSLFYHEYIHYKADKKGFSLTPKGLQAQYMFENTNIFKERPGDFSSHFATVKALSAYQHVTHSRTA